MLGNKPSRNACAVVTGAGSGIGRAFARALGERGGRVVCSDLDGERAEETAAQIRSNGGQALGLETDVTAIEAVEELARRAEEWNGDGVDVVVNNAGVASGGSPVGEIPLADWHWVMNVNLWGVIHGCHVFAPRLRQQGAGGIINVGSAASFAAAPDMASYNVTKAGVLALTETLAAEMAGTGVHVTALCPTWVQSNIARDGRITGQAASLAGRMIESGMSADKVARQTLNALDRGRLYVMPQRDARTIWRAKRWMPAFYARSAGWLQRLNGRKIE